MTKIFFSFLTKMVDRSPSIKTYEIPSQKWKKKKKKRIFSFFLKTAIVAPNQSHDEHTSMYKDNISHIVFKVCNKDDMLC